MTEDILLAVSDSVSDNNCVVALGGGADSAVLLWAAVRSLGRDRVRAAFVFHDLEGSGELRRSATAVAETCGVTCEVLDRPVSDDGNLEARARAARYEAIESLIEPGTIALTAHTADDQAETVLMRLFRGSGTGALSGIPPERGVWRRPFLAVSRATLRSIAQENGLPFADDPANTDQRFMRPRIRHSVMPVIESKCGPDVSASIRRSSLLLAADDAILEAAAAGIPIVVRDGAVSIPIGPLRSATEPISSRAVRRALRMLMDEHPGSASDVEAVLAVAQGSSPTMISQSLRVALEPPFVAISRAGELPDPIPTSISVGDGFTWFGSDYTTRQASRSPVWVPGGRITVLDEAAVGSTIEIRGTEPGDRIEIDTGSTPVKEALRVAGIPSRIRAHSLAVAVDGKIAAIAGVRIASWARARRGHSVVIIEREVGTWI